MITLTDVEEFEIVDRYTGIGYPDPETMCKGQCEGMGRVPIQEDETDDRFRSLWLEAEKEKPTDDGCHFVKCPDCDGTGQKAETEVILE